MSTSTEPSPGATAAFDSAEAPDERSSSSIVGGALTTMLLATLALQNAVPPLATDMYSPSFPNITADLATTATLVGFTLTTFFIGFGAGQIAGGALSDQIGRRRPMIAGGLIAVIGSIICASSPSSAVLLIGRFFQGFGGGVASAVGRAILVDVAHGHLLARAMSLLQAIGGLAPMIAPVIGGLVVTYASWRMIFWFLTGSPSSWFSPRGVMPPNPFPLSGAVAAACLASCPASVTSCGSGSSSASC